MRGPGGRYRNLDDPEHGERDVATPYWKAISYLSLWLLLGGFLMLPTTFDSDPQLHFSSGVTIVLISALLLSGYALTALLYYAVPSPSFRLESLLVPAASASFFGMCAAAWALVSSTRFNPSLPGCPISLGLTFASFLLFGGLGLWTSNNIRKTTNKKAWPVSRHHGQDSASAQYNPRTSSTYPLTGPAEYHDRNHAHPLQDYNHHLHDYMNSSHEYVHPSARPPSIQPVPGYDSSEYPHPTPLTRRQTEEDMVGRQMAGLLTKPAPVPSPNATQETFHLDWPQGDNESDVTDPPHQTISPLAAGSGQMLSPKTTSRARDRSGSASGIPIIRIGTLSKPEDRGRRTSRNPNQKDDRARSRDERRKEIERESIS